MHPLSSLTPLRFTGPDVRSFLQGQLSNDMTLLTPTRSLLASCNSAQGRVQAVLRLIARREEIIALLPSSMLDTTLLRLSKYMLRAKVVIENAASAWQVLWASPDELSSRGWPQPAELGEHRQHEHISIVRWPDQQAARFLVIQPGHTAVDSAADTAWQLADIRAGLPEILPATHESFVAQMLNLDVLNGISFNKGCYTGQEIIARAHFRGAVKRRMLRFAAVTSAPLPGTRIVAGVEPAGEVVVAANTATGCELLAVISLGHQYAALTLEATQVGLTALSLPYLLP